MKIRSVIPLLCFIISFAAAASHAEQVIIHGVKGGTATLHANERTFFEVGAVRCGYGHIVQHNSPGVRVSYGLSNAGYMVGAVGAEILSNSDYEFSAKVDPGESLQYVVQSPTNQVQFQLNSTGGEGEITVKLELDDSEDCSLFSRVWGEAYVEDGYFYNSAASSNPFNFRVEGSSGGDTETKTTGQMVGIIGNDITGNYIDFTDKFVVEIASGVLESAGFDYDFLNRPSDEIRSELP